MMNFQQIVIPGIILGGLGLTFGLLLAFASKKFFVKVDPRISEAREAMPGANCGACGFPGCDGYAEAVVMGGAKTNLCGAGGAALVEKLAQIMGVAAEEAVRMIAVLKCAGTPDVAPLRAIYEGNPDCREAVVLPGGGAKACAFGCIGFGTCVSVCPFDAIVIQNSISKVIEAKCVGCGACAAACPKELLDIVPYGEKKAHVACNSPHRGADVKKVCAVGCIGCTLCVKACPTQAISMKGSLAYVDRAKCTSCGQCVVKCPVKAIKD